MTRRRAGVLTAVPAVPEPGPATPETWDLGSYPLRYLRCRGYRHDWPAPEERRRWTRVLGANGLPVEYRHALICKRCTLMVIEVINARTGDRAQKAPHYPDGYLRKGLGRLPVADVRLEELRRLETELGVRFEDIPEGET